MATVANRALAGRADPGVGLLIGFLAALPVGAGTPSWFLNKAKAA